jgi:predicted metal-dependent phosphoesterase TrpH
MTDLHIHTNASSDAFTSPEEIVSIALSNHVSTIAITDHRTVKGIAPAMRAGEKSGVEVIPGVEIQATYIETHVHIVGLFIDPAEPSLLDFLSALDAEHEIYHAINNQLMIGALAGMGFPLTIKQIAYLVDSNVGWKAFFINYLEDMGMIDANDEKIKQKITDKLMSVNYYRYKNRKHQADEVITHIHKANGLAILAHPMEYNMEWDEIDAMLAHLKSCGLDGMEVYYYNHDESQQNKLLLLARKYNLFRSGGSDFHGYEKQNGRDIGKGLYNSLVPDDALEEMRSYSIK